MASAGSVGAPAQPAYAPARARPLAGLDCGHCLVRCAFAGFASPLLLPAAACLLLGGASFAPLGRLAGGQYFLPAGASFWMPKPVAPAQPHRLCFCSLTISTLPPLPPPLRKSSSIEKEVGERDCLTAHSPFLSSSSRQLPWWPVTRTLSPGLKGCLAETRSTAHLSADEETTSSGSNSLAWHAHFFLQQTHSYDSLCSSMNWSISSL
mmetsp:Transcript_36312/g.121588  ORF Transcript_36312/g.121588 Transcript_36312/m.121588 type:complete len:208 (-) Transcript_36312:1876-2499(-)